MNALDANDYLNELAKRMRKPMRDVVESFIHVDVYGHVIDIGTKVAFNYSGEVRKGIVRKITKTKRLRWAGNGKYERCVNFHVEEGKTGRISKVTRPQNMVVLPDVVSLT